MKKLLFDENISQRVIARISSIYNDAVHVKDFGLEQTDDNKIWNFAKTNDYIIVSKDSDFHQKSPHLNLFFCELEIVKHLVLFKYLSIIIPLLRLFLKMNMKVFWC